MKTADEVQDDDDTEDNDNDMMEDEEASIVVLPYEESLLEMTDGGLFTA